MTHALAGLYACLFSVLLIGVTATQLAAREGDTVIAVFPPTMTGGDVFRAADSIGAVVLGFGRADWIAAIRGVPANHRARLYDSGALALLDPGRAAQICGLRLTKNAKDAP